MKAAIDLAQNGMQSNLGGPFGAVIVKNDQIISTGSNLVTSHLDPTAHAEICAIRIACKNINSFSLEDCEIYTSCEPCPMCLGAIYWARLKTIYYAATKEDAAKINFDDENFYAELEKAPTKRKIPMVPMMRLDAVRVFDCWQQKQDRVHY